MATAGSTSSSISQLPPELIALLQGAREFNAPEAKQQKDDVIGAITSGLSQGLQNLSDDLKEQNNCLLAALNKQTKAMNSIMTLMLARLGTEAAAE